MSTVAVHAHPATRLSGWLPWIGWALSLASVSVLLMRSRRKVPCDPWDVAAWAGTNAWDALTRVGSRVPRVYVEDGQVVDTQSRYRP